MNVTTVVGSKMNDNALASGFTWRSSAGMTDTISKSSSSIYHTKNNNSNKHYIICVQRPLFHAFSMLARLYCSQTVLYFQTFECHRGSTGQIHFWTSSRVHNSMQGTHASILLAQVNYVSWSEK